MVELLLVAAALQLRTATTAVAPLVRPSPQVLGRLAADSARDARQAREAQSRFELGRRAELPWEDGAAGRCDVRVGRFCWWYDERMPTLAPERESIQQRRFRLVQEFDALGTRHPGDDWLAGMRVHYRLEARLPAAADSVARECGGTAWWCSALAGYAAHAVGDARRADSAFSAALSGMPPEQRCRWTDVSTLLPGGARGRYASLACPARARLDERYWLLARPRLGAPANEWRNEFHSRRVQGWLAERSTTPQSMRWGRDAEELLLRYGWPLQWGRVRNSTIATMEYGVIGHDPSPSFAFGAREELLDSLAADRPDGWDLRDERAPSRYAPPLVKRVAGVTAQLARFRRGDSTLLVASYVARDDSLRAPRALLAAGAEDGAVLTSAPDSTLSGHATVTTPWAPRLAGIEISDSATATFARSRTLFPATGDATKLALSDLLLYRPADEPATTLDSALARAVRGDTVYRARAVGLYWESYGADGEPAEVEMGVTVERVDRGWMRSARQRLGMEEEDSPLRMRWPDNRPSGSTASRSVTVDLNKLPAGRYRVTLTMTPAGGDAVRTSREIQLLER